MTQDELKRRTRQFTIDIIRFVKKLPNDRDTWIVGDQLYRAGSSVGANYRASCRSKTKPTFIHKMSVVEEEADESNFWLDICLELKIGDRTEAERLYKESEELTKIFTSTNKTLSQKYSKN